MIRRALIPCYLVVCLILGGASAAGYAGNLLLQLAALPILAWALLARRRPTASPHNRGLLILAAGLLLQFALQLLPLPPAIWTALPGRAAIADGYRLLGVPLPWLPISLTPEATLASLLWLLPAFAVLAGMALLGAFRASWIAWSIAAVTGVAVMLGALQVVGGPGSPWYLYAITNDNQAVGFFANSNHMATLLVVTIPFVVALQAHGLARAESPRRASALMVITAAVLVTIAVGLLINTSLAGLGLAVPVTLASFILLGARDARRARLGTAVSAALALAAVAAIFLAPFADRLSLAGKDVPESLGQLGRSVSIPTTLGASAHYLPFGAGIGSFRGVYQTLEDPRATITTYMNHAHSDLAEIALECGLTGLALLALFLWWWGRRALALWRAEEPDYFARAAVIASGAMMAHSLVDYPLRTAGLAALFAACAALMAEVRQFEPAARRGRGDGRHYVIA